MEERDCPDCGCPMLHEDEMMGRIWSCFECQTVFIVCDTKEQVERLVANAEAKLH